jgi:hypothetical protein
VKGRERQRETEGEREKKNKAKQNTLDREFELVSTRELYRELAADMLY